MKYMLNLVEHSFKILFILTFDQHSTIKLWINSTKTRFMPYVL